MSPKEKARELVDKFHPMTYTAVHAQNMTGEYTDAIRCALILVNEILKNSVGYNAYDGVTDNDIWADNNYWEEVKSELEKL